MGHNEDESLSRCSSTASTRSQSGHSSSRRVTASSHSPAKPSSSSKSSKGHHREREGSVQQPDKSPLCSSTRPPSASTSSSSHQPQTPRAHPPGRSGTSSRRPHSSAPRGSVEVSHLSSSGKSTGLPPTPTHTPSSSYARNMDSIGTGMGQSVSLTSRSISNQTGASGGRQLSRQDSRRDSFAIDISLLVEGADDGGRKVSNSPGTRRTSGIDGPTFIGLAKQQGSEEDVEDGGGGYRQTEPKRSESMFSALGGDESCHWAGLASNASHDSSFRHMDSFMSFADSFISTIGGPGGDKSAQGNGATDAQIRTATTSRIRCVLRELLRRARLAVVRRSRSLRRPTPEVMCRNTYFACFPPAMVEQMVATMTLEVYFAGEVLVHEGSRDRSCCYIMRGSARTAIGDQPLATVQEGSVVGGEGFCLGTQHEMGAVARQICVVWRLRRRSVEKMSREERIHRDRFFAHHRAALDVDSLRSIPCFMFLSNEALRSLSLNATPVIYPSGTEIVVPPETFILTLCGTLHVTNSKANSGELEDEDTVKNEMEFCFHIAQSSATDLCGPGDSQSTIDVSQLYAVNHKPVSFYDMMPSQGSHNGVLKLRGRVACGVGPAVHNTLVPSSIKLLAAPKRKHDVQGLLVHSQTLGSNVLNLIRRAVRSLTTDRTFVDSFISVAHHGSSGNSSSHQTSVSSKAARMPSGGHDAHPPNHGGGSSSSPRHMHSLNSNPLIGTPQQGPESGPPVAMVHFFPTDPGPINRDEFNNSCARSSSVNMNPASASRGAPVKVVGSLRHQQHHQRFGHGSTSTEISTSNSALTSSHSTNRGEMGSMPSPGPTSPQLPKKSATPARGRTVSHV